MGDRRDAALALPDLRHQEHVGAVAVDLEPLGGLVGQDRGREGTETLPELDLHVQRVPHLGVPRIGEDAASPEGTGPELHPALEPSDDVAVGDETRGLPHDVGVREHPVRGPGAVEVPADLRVVVFRPEIRVRPRRTARLLAQGVVDVVGDPHRSAGVAGRGLHEQLLEGCLADHAPVGDAVQGDAAGHAEAGEAGLLVDVAGHAEHDLLAHLLDGGGDVELPLRHPGLRLAGWPPEEVAEGAVGHGQAVVVGEVLHVELEGAVIVEMDDLLHDPVDVDRLPVGGEAHDLVLGAVDLEPEVVREGAVEQPEAVGEADLLEEGDVVPLAHAEGSGGPLADAVHREDGRLLERRDEEARGGVAHVVLGEEDRPLVGPQLPADDRRHPELLLDPHRHRLAERAERAGEGGDVRRQHPLELQERLVVEADGVEVPGADAGLLEDVLHRPRREVLVVFLAGEALLLAGGHDDAVPEQGGGRVVVEAGDPEDVHARTGAGLRPGLPADWARGLSRTSGRSRPPGRAGPCA